MSHFAEAFAWCMLQVTLFSIIAAGLYGVVVRFRLGGAAADFGFQSRDRGTAHAALRIALAAVDRDAA